MLLLILGGTLVSSTQLGLTPEHAPQVKRTQAREDSTPDLYRIKVAALMHLIDGKELISRMNRQNRHNYRGQ
jgi:hypothetical protein